MAHSCSQRGVIYISRYYPAITSLSRFQRDGHASGAATNVPSTQHGRYGAPTPTYDQAVIGDLSRALRGWTDAGASATGINFENFSGPLQPGFTLGGDDATGRGVWIPQFSNQQFGATPGRWFGADAATLDTQVFKNGLSRFALTDLGFMG